MNRSVLIALAIMVAAVAWVASGQFGSPSPAASQAATEAAAPTAAAPKPPPQVRVARITAEPLTNEVVLQGRTEAMRSVELRAEVAGVVTELPVARGARVRAGDVLVRLEENERQLEVARGRALVAQREIEFNAARALQAHGFQTDVRLAEATSALAAARAQLRSAELALEKVVIRAPFDGIQNTRAVEIGDFLDKGGRVATVIDLDPIRVVGFVSERNVLELQVGQTGTAHLFDDERFEGTLGYVAAVAEPATRTFRVELNVPNPTARIVEGLTAQLRLPVARKVAHRVSPSVLTLNDAGSIGIKIVDPEARVRFVPVRIVGDTPDGRIWVDGLPQQAVAITVGQEFVVPGQEVRPVEAPMPEGRLR